MAINVGSFVKGLEKLGANGEALTGVVGKAAQKAQQAAGAAVRTNGVPFVAGAAKGAARGGWHPPMAPRAPKPHRRLNQYKRPSAAKPPSGNGATPASASPTFPTRSTNFGDFETSMKRAEHVTKGGKYEVPGMAGFVGNVVGGTIGQLPFVGKHAMAGYDWVAGHGLQMGIKRGMAAYAAMDAAGRVLGGGGIFKDKYGNTDIVGVPLI